MRYWKGSLAVSPTQDYPLLQQVLRSTFVTHQQLYAFMKLDYRTTSRNAFNNRVLRLVKHDYLIRDEIPHKTEGYVYSISEKGASELIGLGEYCTGPTRRPRDGQLPRAIYHAVELNEIHLALKRSQQLVRWMAESEIHSRNELTEDRYCKDYDAVVTVRNEIGERSFALEYERSPKARKEYLDIGADIEGERAVDRFLYLVPNYDLLSFLVGCFATVRRPIYFGLARDFLDRMFDVPLRGTRPGAMTTLRNLLQ
jgi:hypothetical protein